MPYKNIEDRRKALKRYKLRHPEKSRERQRIQAKAIYANPIRQKCQIEGCETLGERHHPDYSKPKEIIWLCKKHHEFIHSKNYCSKPDCKNKHLARGMCQKHYSEWRRNK